MESAPATPDPYRIFRTGDWPLSEVNPRVLTADLIESGAVAANYPAPSYGAVPLLPPVPSAPPLNGDDYLGADIWTFDWRRAVAWAPIGVGIVALAAGLLFAYGED